MSKRKEGDETVKKALHEYARPHIAEFHVVSSSKQKDVVVRCVAPNTCQYLEFWYVRHWTCPTIKAGSKQQKALATIDSSSP